MVNIFNEILTAIKTEISPVDITRNWQNQPAVFPVVTMREIDNSVLSETSDSANIENHVNWACQFEIYSNLVAASGQIDGIAATIDGVMASYRFKRIMAQYIDNPFDTTLTRYVMRYDGIVSKDKVVL